MLVNDWQITKIVAFFSLSLTVILLACSSEADQPVTEPTSTAAPVASETAVPEGTLIVGALDIEPSPEVSVFENLLSRIPDNESTRSQVTLVDVDSIMQIVGFEHPAPGANAQERFEALYSQIFFPPGDLRIPRPAWPQVLSDYQGEVGRELFRTLGFDFLSVEQFIFAGQHPKIYDVAFGQFSSTATKTALASCQCEQTSILQHAGVKYYSWGEESVTTGRYLDIPFYDDIGHGVRLLVLDGEAHYSLKDIAIPELIDVIQGNANSLADNDDYLNAVRWISALGTFGKMVLFRDGFSMDEVVRSGSSFNSVRTGPTGPAVITESTGESARRAIEKAPLMEPFSFVLSGGGFDGEKPFTGLVVAHEDEASALANRLRLIDRITTGATAGRIVNGEYQDTSWSDLITLVEVTVEGRLLIARLYSKEPGRTYLQAPSNTILTVHE